MVLLKQTLCLSNFAISDLLDNMLWRRRKRNLDEKGKIIFDFKSVQG